MGGIQFTIREVCCLEKFSRLSYCFNLGMIRYIPERLSTFYALRNYFSFPHNQRSSRTVSAFFCNKCQLNTLPHI